MLRKLYVSRRCINWRGRWAWSIVAIFILSGCATTAEPKKGGFFSNLHNLLSGAYEKSLDRKKQALEDARSGQDDLKNDVIKSGDEVAYHSEGLKTAENKLLIFQNQLGEMKGRLQTASKAQRIEATELTRLEAEIALLEKQAIQISNEPVVSAEEKNTRIIELENRKQELENALQAALVF